MKRLAQLITIGLLLTAYLSFARPLQARCIVDGDNVSSDCYTEGATCDTSLCGSAPTDPYSSGSPNWECKTDPECFVKETYNPITKELGCSYEYQYSQQCIATDYCCDGTGGSQKICFRACRNRATD